MNLSGKVKALLIVAGLATALLVGYWTGSMHQNHGVQDTGKPSAAAEAGKWTCGMHPFIIQDKPGICPICNMELTPLKAGAGGQGGGERQVKHWASPMDPTYVRQEPGKDHMGHDLVPVYADGGEGGVAVDPVTMQSMGVRTANVEVRDLQRSLRAVGLVTFDESSQYVINSKVEGWIERLHVNVEGQPVRKGQPLLEIYSPDLLAAQQEYLLALDSSSRLATSPFPEVAEGGKRPVEAARNRLRNWDISDSQIEQLEQSRQVRKTLTLYSPYGGTVTMKKALAGDARDGGRGTCCRSPICRGCGSMPRSTSRTSPGSRSASAPASSFPTERARSLRERSTISIRIWPGRRAPPRHASSSPTPAWNSSPTCTPTCRSPPRPSRGPWPSRPTRCCAAGRGPWSSSPGVTASSIRAR